jgi:hypothetical protein
VALGVAVYNPKATTAAREAITVFIKQVLWNWVAVARRRTGSTRLILKSIGALRPD